MSGEVYIDCCGRFHAGEAKAPTAERLMRSRYSAFEVGDADYLLRTWHPSTRPDSLELDTAQRWTRLDIERTVRGGPFDSDGVVEFTAYSTCEGERLQQHETSRFVRLDRLWFYVDALE